MKKIKLFALNASAQFGKDIADRLSVPLSSHEEYYFDDRECYCQSLENVRGCDVFVISSLYTDETETVNDKIVKTVILCGALRDASAARITLVSPYLAFSRQDRKTVSRAPITTKYLARMFTSMWVDRLLSIDVHNPTAIQNAYSIPCDLLEANSLFARQVQAIVVNDAARHLTVLSPDSGGLDRARKFRKILNDLLKTDVGIACMDKVHTGREIKGYGVLGDVSGRDVLIYDDMISSGKTNLECVKAVLAKGGRVLATCATNGLFVGKANEYLDTPDLPIIMVSDTIPPFRLENEAVLSKTRIVKTVNLFSEAILRIHRNESISDLLDNGP